MRRQQKIWNDEHKNPQAMPSLAEKKPSSYVIDFLKYLKTRGFSRKGKVIDIGCGKGRNSIYLAQKGFEVYAMDYIDCALDFAKKRIIEEKITDKITIVNSDIGKRWPFEDGFFDLAIDCFSSIDIETKKGREMCKNEMFRTLKPKGIAMVACISTNDKFEKELLQKSPGKEKGTVFWPNGKFEKLYSKNELREFFLPLFEILKLETVYKRNIIFGKEYEREVYFLILRKY